MIDGYLKVFILDRYFDGGFNKNGDSCIEIEGKMKIYRKNGSIFI